MWKEDKHKVALYQKTYEWITTTINKGAPNFKPPGDFKVGRMPNGRDRPHKRRLFGVFVFSYLLIGFLLWAFAKFINIDKIKLRTCLFRWPKIFAPLIRALKE